MDHHSENSKPPSGRRRFISDTIKITVLGSILVPLDQSCNNKKAPVPDPLPKQPIQEHKKFTSKKITRKKWSHESLVMNTKTKVVHFPTSKVYTYYDEIKPAHLQEISIAAWAAQLQEPVRLYKEQSGNILEILSMQSLNKGINEESLSTATDTLSKAFSKECENTKGFNSNTMNFRLHELILQLITLNKTIPPEMKWSTFNAKIKRPEKLRKRQQWMENETNFNERVKYITDHENDYIARLTKRAQKYSFN